MDHLLTHCTMAPELWAFYFCNVWNTVMMPNSLRGLSLFFLAGEAALKSIGVHLSGRHTSLLNVWIIWRKRNSGIFNSVELIVTEPETLSWNPTLEIFIQVVQKNRHNWIQSLSFLYVIIDYFLYVGVTCIEPTIDLIKRLFHCFIESTTSSLVEL